MEQNIIQTDIHRAVEAIKVAILQTRRKVMIQANKDSLALNYSIGGYISCRKQTSHWGDKVLDAISSQLQQELPRQQPILLSHIIPRINLFVVIRRKYTYFYQK